MKLTDFIDFSVFEDFDDTWSDDGDFMTSIKDENHEYFIDSDIEGVDRSEGVKLIAGARKSFIFHVKLKNKYLKDNCDEENIRNVCFYVSRDKKFYCILIDLEYDDGPIYMLGILEKKTGKYLVVGCQWENLFIKHHMFNYGDSSGNGVSDNIPISINDEEDKYLDKNPDPLDIIDAIDDYFNTMCDNFI
ncbi:hypothetical protein QLL95_gp0221 [Cotonvirus japonicus]|uniref:Uncharacterized protein n=1 Tax=Cotonvirus japonicus TaxID=2811091 RepID=A0ABM7NRC9_9VIRU|nr:hypothetical protein QLL95_gp0221 [Cotonvirus japonicus]BCS82710.1 hypothetical protein [Cotonvirus japonicus]